MESFLDQAIFVSPTLAGVTFYGSVAGRLAQVVQTGKLILLNSSELIKDVTIKGEMFYDFKIYKKLY